MFPACQELLKFFSNRIECSLKVWFCGHCLSSGCNSLQNRYDQKMKTLFNCLVRLFLQAFLADSEKSCFIIGNLTVLKVSCNTLKTFINMYAEYVHHSAAAGAHKVTMGNGAGIAMRSTQTDHAFDPNRPSVSSKQTMRSESNGNSCLYTAPHR